MTPFENLNHYLGWCPNAPAMRTAPAGLQIPARMTNPLEPDGSGGRPGRIDRGINLATRSTKILIRNKQLLWFSLLAGLVMTFLFITRYGLHLLGTYPYDAIDFPKWLVLTFVTDLVTIFCLAVLLAGLLLSISSVDSGRSPSFREGLSRAKDYLRPLMIWSVFIALTGTAIYVPLQYSGYLHHILYPVLDQFPFNFILLPEVFGTGPIGGTFALSSAVTSAVVISGINIVLIILTLFVIPLLVLEEKQIYAAFIGSVSLMKKMWGEIIICFFIFGLGLVVVTGTSLLFRLVYGIVAPDMLLFWYPGDAWIIGGLLYILALCGLAFVIATIAGIATLDLYTSAKSGLMPEQMT